MVLLGTIVNALAIIIGSIIGSFLSNIPNKVRVTVMQGLGLAVLVLGVTMGLKSDNFLLVIFSVVFGGIIGEVFKIEDKLNSLGEWIERKVSKEKKGNIANAFVTSTLVYTIGAMAILGALNSGLSGGADHKILYIKSMLDGFSAVIFASAMGIGVIFSSIPVLIYQGIIALLAGSINELLSESLLNSVISEITATGGILIIAIAINILEIKKINVANLLPAVIIAPIGVIIIHQLSQYFAFFN